ncbi:hypothetical protein [Fictibacillus enclensis]|uniref:hypothetical protein n=1 Tax=Fictibacillus enclensis TaxID=1017270 RepID=UPI0024C03CA0|nr:hypothetical protein [Fictibacillus enclensis]WHY73743.1 hypothetical protein QNH15_07465 [Fictibacillus enclensis]
MEIHGNILLGDLDQGTNEFSLQQVKHFMTQSTLSSSQLERLYNYLQKHQNDAGGQVISLYDSMLVRLSQQEISMLLKDLENIQSHYH